MIDLSVCLSVCGPNEIFCADPLGRGSILRRRCATLGTSGLWMTSRLTIMGHMALAALQCRGGVCCHECLVFYCHCDSSLFVYSIGCVVALMHCGLE